MLVELAGAKFPTTFTVQGVPKIIKITKVYLKKFWKYFFKTG